MSQVTQKQFEKALVVAATFFDDMQVVTTDTGATEQKNIGAFQKENFLNAICWKLGSMMEKEGERFDRLKRIAHAQRRAFDGTEIALEKLTRITQDLQNCEAQIETIGGALLSAKGVYAEETGREYGKRPADEPVKSIAGLEALDRILGGKTQGLETGRKGEAGKVS